MTLLAKILKWVITHPVISLVGVVFVIAFIAVVVPGKESNEGAAPTPKEKPDHKKNTPENPSTPPLVDDDQPDDDFPASTKPPKLPKGQKGKVAPDPHDYDPETRARTRQQLEEQPAMQHIPLDEKGVYGDLDDLLPDGRLLVKVRYKGSKQHAETVWNNFLKRHGDKGTAYVVIFQK